jgi:indolepyruvate ferredoxin oxidoreductase beta subunit
MEEYNILIAGVGGQGVLFISEVLGEAALEADLNVRVAEIHGMAQRGGSVICNVRLGDKVYSPTIVEGEAHLIIALEPIEALRHVQYANPKTFIIFNTNTIEPPGLYLTNQTYPDVNSIIDTLRRVSKKMVPLDALQLAKKAGNPATQNTVMLGFTAASGILPINLHLLKKVIVKLVKKKLKEVNIKAFDLGVTHYKKLKASPIRE